MKTLEQDGGALAPESSRVEFQVGQGDLKKGLMKLKRIWAQPDSETDMKFVLFEVREDVVILRAWNNLMTGVATVKLYERSAGQGSVALVGQEVLELVGSCGPLISIAQDERGDCVFQTKGYEWTLKAKRDLSPARAFALAEGCFEALIPYQALKEGLRVCEICASSKPEEPTLYGVRFTASGAESSDGHRIAVFQAAMGTADFAVPTPVIPTLTAMLESVLLETVRVRRGDSQVEVYIGDDMLVFNQAVALRDFSPVHEGTSAYTPIVEADRDSLLLALRRGMLLNGKGTTFIMTRQDDDLVISAMSGGRRVGWGQFRATWMAQDQEFTAHVDGSFLEAVIGVLNGKKVKLGRGLLPNGPFLCVKEDDRRLVVMERVPNAK